MKTILVTGHTGFIGKHLVNALENYKLIGLTNTNFESLNFKQIKRNITKLTSNEIHDKINIVVHLAATSDVNFCQHNPTDVFCTNVVGTKNILELARKNDSKIIYASTSHVYGVPKNLPIKESDEKHPSSIYAGTKLAGEILCESYAKSYGLDVGVVRFFSVYGPDSPQHSLVYGMIKQIIEGNAVQLGNITTSRDFIYIDDVIQAIKIIMRKNKGFNDFNIGSGKSHQVSEICNQLIKLSKKDIQIHSIRSKRRRNDALNIIADITKIKKLGWIPNTSLQDGLRLTFDWHQLHLNQKSSHNHSKRSLHINC